MMKAVTAAALCLAALLTTATVRAEPKLAATIERSPYGYVENGRPAGLLFELGEAIFREAGFEPVNVLMPMETAVKTMTTGDVHMLLSNQSSELDTVGLDLGEVVSLEFSALVRAGSGVSSLRTLRTRRVALVRDSLFDDAIRGLPRMATVPVNEYDDAVRLLAAGEVDAAMGGLAGLTTAAKKLPRRLFDPPLPLGFASIRLYGSPSFPADRATRLQQAIKTLRRQGALSDIVTKYSL